MMSRALRETRNRTLQRCRWNRHGTNVIKITMVRGRDRAPQASLTAAPEAVTPAGEAEMQPVSTGYADVNGIKLCHEDYGPVVLLTPSSDSTPLNHSLQPQLRKSG